MSLFLSSDENHPPHQQFSVFFVGSESEVRNEIFSFAFVASFADQKPVTRGHKIGGRTPRLQTYRASDVANAMTPKDPLHVARLHLLDLRIPRFRTKTKCL